MLKYYPSNTVLKNKFLNLCGQHYGILESQILTSAQGKYTPKISVCTANMPAYQKATIDERAEINHHLSGYGVLCLRNKPFALPELRKEGPPAPVEQGKRQPLLLLRKGHPLAVAAPKRG